MAFLEQFSEEEQDMIVSLPYRAGLWLSISDDAGGVAADYEELHALENIIEKKAAGAPGSPFVKEVMQQAMAWQDRWKDWAQAIQNVEQDCTRVTEILSAKLTEQDVERYHQNLLSVTLEVAKAFREIDLNAGLCGRMKIKMRLFWDKVKALFGYGPEMKRHLNISPEEEAAIARLKAALNKSKGVGERA